MSISSILRYILLNLALVGVLALGVNSSADTTVASETTSNHGGITDEGGATDSRRTVTIATSTNVWRGKSAMQLC